MQLIKTLFSIVVFMALSAMVYAQIPQKVIVEHFTNTRCSICASSSKNPAFYDNLANHPGVLHISYHPSSPYSNCFFNLHNPSENDDRTKYYGTFGSTPDLIVQGKLNPLSTPFGSPDVFSPYLNQTAAFTIEILQTKTLDEKIEATVNLTTVIEHNYTGGQFLIALAEKVVNYDAPNGEDVHYDVFRKALTDIEGDAIDLPAVGESVTFSYAIDKDEAWDFSQMFVYAILNDPESKEVLQSEAADPSDNVTSTDESALFLNATIYPNPVQDILQINLDQGVRAEMEILNAAGSVLEQVSFETTAIVSVNDFAPGIYFLKIESEKGRLFHKVIVE